MFATDFPSYLELEAAGTVEQWTARVTGEVAAHCTIAMLRQSSAPKTLLFLARCCVVDAILRRVGFARPNLARAFKRYVHETMPESVQRSLFAHAVQKTLAQAAEHVRCTGIDAAALFDTASTPLSRECRQYLRAYATLKKKTTDYTLLEAAMRHYTVNIETFFVSFLKSN